MVKLRSNEPRRVVSLQDMTSTLSAMPNEPLENAAFKMHSNTSSSGSSLDSGGDGAASSTQTEAVSAPLSPSPRSKDKIMTSARTDRTGHHGHHPHHLPHRHIRGVGNNNNNNQQQRQTSKIFDDASITAGYESVPLLEIDRLPRGGISFETKAVGRVQFGIPPETIKDSMVLGMEVPAVYIVPIERFCRELGPALGINLAEFEFPAYFNYFVRGKKVQLVVDSDDAEIDIRSVFGETLLGPEHFRNHQHPCGSVNEDFDPDFPSDCRPDFYKEFLHFRTAEKTSDHPELCVDTLLDFVHFSPDRVSGRSSNVVFGVPPTPPQFEMIPDETLLELRLREREAPGSIAVESASDSEEPAMPPPSANLRRNSTSAGAELLQQSSSHRTAASNLSSCTRDDSVLASKEVSGPPPRVLQRSNSDSSFSSNPSQSSAPRSRRGSIELDEDRKPTFESPNAVARTGRRRSSLPISGTLPPTRNFPLMDRNVTVRESGKRDSLISTGSELTADGGGSRYSRTSRISTGSAMIGLGYDFIDEGDDLQESHWMYSQAKWLGEVAIVYPPNATSEQKLNKTAARLEIFKMAGGTEYIVHDVDENNIIVGKARFSGTVRVPDELSVQGFISASEITANDSSENDDDGDTILGPGDGTADAKAALSSMVAPTSTFYPPSFGVTVLGNSHGFDKNGATSGYVLWVNGRGIMIDPPPFSSSTLEREGIRPNMIMAIIITHCHADHDAGAFQKIMTGSRVAIITTPTIYRSFIRKYSFLSGLRSTLLRHSHRHRPAIIGQPLRFQGAVFHFTYTLHTIPCISFKVEWRGKSIVFTGDHMNIPEKIDSLEEKGTLSKGRADELRRLPVQECDVLLHEAGSPPIHTPLKVLQELPQHVRDRLYVVHTAAIPSDSGLRVAPTGTAGTIRLDGLGNEPAGRISDSSQHIDVESLRDGANQNLTVHGNFDSAIPMALANSFSGRNGSTRVAPLVFLRPTDVSDAWFLLNLLSAVPFLSSLSYGHTMEVLEIANVQLFCDGQVVIEGPRRQDFLCVIWEGTCMERGCDVDTGDTSLPIIWHAGDWTGPISLQPDPLRSARPKPGETPRDIVAISKEGVKVIILSMKDVNRILKTGSKLYSKYMALEEEPMMKDDDNLDNYQSCGCRNYRNAENDNLLNVLQCNSILGSLYATQKRHLESLAEGPRFFAYQDPLWRVGDPVDYAYVIVAGTATLGRNSTPIRTQRVSRRGSTGCIATSLRSIDEHSSDRRTPTAPVESDKLLQKVNTNSEYARLETLLQLRSEDVEDSMASDNSNVRTVATHRDRFANKVLQKLYSRHAYTENLVFSRGNFLCDVTRMVSGNLANNAFSSTLSIATGGNTRSSIGSVAGDHHFHTSNLIAGPQGCVVMVFPRATLVSFLDNNPGVLLCLLGTQAVV